VCSLACLLRSVSPASAPPLAAMPSRVQSQRPCLTLLLAAVVITLALSNLVPVSFVGGARAPPALRAVSARSSRAAPLARRAATEDTMTKVAEVISKQLGVEQANVSREATLTALGADSLDIVESVMALEEAFDVELPDEETTKLTNVGDVADLIQVKLA